MARLQCFNDVTKQYNRLGATAPTLFQPIQQNREEIAMNRLKLLDRSTVPQVDLGSQKTFSLK